MLGSLKATGEDLWLKDATQALEQAKTLNKQILLVFSDLELCPPCKRLKREVFERDTFKRYAAENLVCVLIACDLRSSKTIDPAQENLRMALSADTFPTWWLLDSDAAPLLSGGYIRGGPQALINLFDKSSRPDSAEKLGRQIQKIISD
ncbi:MAG: thioredoxin family protein [Opitutales bacterium]